VAISSSRLDAGVAPWVIAGPVLERIAGLLLHPREDSSNVVRYAQPQRRRAVDEVGHLYVSPGAADRLPCSFSEPEDDPVLVANVRWTLARLASELRTVATTQPGRILIRRASELMAAIGPGAELRPAGWSLRRTPLTGFARRPRL